MREFKEKIVWNMEIVNFLVFFIFYEIYYCRFYKSVLDYICIHELVYYVNSSTQKAVFLINVRDTVF